MTMKKYLKKRIIPAGLSLILIIILSDANDDSRSWSLVELPTRITLSFE